MPQPARTADQTGQVVAILKALPLYMGLLRGTALAAHETRSNKDSLVVIRKNRYESIFYSFR